jgi:uncharacterized protein (UPF0332 family)
MTQNVFNDHLNKADLFLNDARLLLDNGRFDSCVSRAYYAMFRAAVALLSHLGYERRAWNHGGLMSAIDKQVVQRHQLLDPSEADWFRDAYNLRCDADYKYQQITREKAVKLIETAEEFLIKIKEVIDDVVES